MYWYFMLLVGGIISLLNRHCDPNWCTSLKLSERCPLSKSCFYLLSHPSVWLDEKIQKFKYKDFYVPTNQEPSSPPLPPIHFKNHHVFPSSIACTGEGRAQCFRKPEVRLSLRLSLGFRVWQMERSRAAANQKGGFSQGSTSNVLRGENFRTNQVRQ